MTTRLRRPFHYSDENDDDDLSIPSILDEQEQESLIQTLATQNESRNISFHRVLFFLPTLGSIPFFIHLLTILFSSRHTHLAPFPLILLALTSLGSTTFLLLRLGRTETGFDWLDEWASQSSEPSSGREGVGNRREDEIGISLAAARIKARKRLGNAASSSTDGILGYSDAVGGAKSPLEWYLPYLNLLLVVLTLVMGLLAEERVKRVSGGGGGMIMVWLGALPGVVFAVVIGAKVMMAGVNPERELNGLKYGYKGA